MEFSPLSLIYSHIPARGVEDGMWWRVKKVGFSIFGPSIMSYRTHLAWYYCLGEVFGVATHPKGCVFLFGHRLGTRF